MDKKQSSSKLTISEDMMAEVVAPTASRELAPAIALTKRTLYQWRVGALIVGLCLVGAVVFILVRKPQFRSETVILYREGIRASYLGPDASDSVRNLGVKLREMLFARPRLEKIIDEFDLYPVTKRKEGPVAAVDEFRKGIQFKVRATDTFAISYDGRTPDEVQAVTSRLAEALVEENTRLRIEQAKIQSEFLTAEKQRSEQELKEKEREFAKFLAAHPEFAMDAAAGAGSREGASIRAAAAQRSGGDPALMALERQAPRIRTLLTSPGPVPRQPVPGAPPPDPALAAARAQAESALATANRDLADRQARFTEQHPDVVAAKRRVKEAEASLRRADDAMSAPAPGPVGGGAASEPDDDTPYDGAAERAKLQGQLSKIEAEIASRKKRKTKPDDAAEASDMVNRVVALETDWARISRDVSEARERMNAMETKHFRAQMEASSELGGYAGQMLVLDPAFKPTVPLPPGKSVILGGALAGALTLALLVALARALLDDNLYEPADMPRGVDLLAVVPRGSPRRWWRRG